MSNSDMVSQLELGKPDDRPGLGNRVNGVFWILLLESKLGHLCIRPLVSGKLVEDDEGSFALWISYLLTGAAANLVSWLVLPRNAVSIGSSGAVFGLFAISVLVKMRWDWRRILEVLILGQFVLKKVMEEAQASARLSGTIFGGSSLYKINHIAHLCGALIGVILIWLLGGIPTRPSTQDTSGLRRRADSARAQDDSHSL